VGEAIFGLIKFGLLTFLAAVAVNLVVSVVGFIWAAVLRQQAGVDQIRVRLAAYSRLITGLQNRIEARKNTTAGAASELFGAQRREKQLRARIRELEIAPHRFVRLVGQEVLPNKPFEVLALNSSVAHQVKRGERHPFYDSSWAVPQPIHIWAKGEAEAVAEFERLYPRSAGFKPTHLGPVPEGGTATPSGDRLVPKPGRGEEP